MILNSVRVSALMVVSGHGARAYSYFYVKKYTSSTILKHIDIIIYLKEYT